ncbi:MAG: DAK2 domain-containing protein [Bacillota bacterium]|nr:DAK2 domain-containing protein [Bacillota bacterium]
MRSIDADLLKQMYISGANNLYNHYPEIDRLNVFPVPDGDTGMNMNLTFTSGMKEIQNRNDADVYSLSKAFSRGLLMGARGNSGVITSQVFRGFADSLEGLEVINVKSLVEAFVKAKEVAYKAVMKPVEGTILTVIRESSAALKDKEGEIRSIEQAMDIMLDEAYASLQRTPDLLPVLKEVGVVDSGGTGLWRIIEGMNLAVHGKMVQRLDNVETSAQIQQGNPLENIGSYAGAALSEDEEGYGYCTQFILKLGTAEEGKKPFSEKEFKNYLETNGKSVVTVRDDEIVKVHVHTLYPGQMLNYAQNYGEFVTIIIENMSEEHNNIQEGKVATDMVGNLNALHSRGHEEELVKEGPLEKYAIVAVSSGKGMDEIFRELGAAVIVSGGQTMNPSTEDFVSAINKAHAENVYILPNNSNIVMAASQACEVVEGCNARVVSSTTIPQGLAALMQYNPEDENPDTVYDDMKSALRSIRSGSVTYAIKDTDIDGIHITKDYYMAMGNGKSIVSCVKDKLEALSDLVNSLVDDEVYSLMVFAGSDVTDEEMEAASNMLNEKYGENIEADIRRGDQPVYSFIVGAQ